MRNFRSLPGTINGNNADAKNIFDPKNEEHLNSYMSLNQFELFNENNLPEETTDAPEGINLNLFKTVSSWLNIPQPQTIKRLK